MKQSVTNTIFNPEYKYKYSQVDIFWRIQMGIYSGLEKIILTDVCEYKYKYKNYLQFFFMDIKAIKVCNLMQICAMIY